MEFFLGQLSDEVALRLTKVGNNVKGKQIVLKVMIFDQLDGRVWGGRRHLIQYLSIPSR